MKKYKEYNSLHYIVNVYIDNKIIKLKAYLDTGNTLTDPITKKKVILTSSKAFNSYKYYYIPYETINTNGILKCIKINSIYIEGIGLRKDVVLGITNKKLKVNGVDCLLNNLLMKG